MKRAFVIVASSLFLSSLALAEPPSPTPLPSLPRPIPVKPIMFVCLDPAAAAIDYTLLSKPTPTSGLIRIKGTVKNVGNAPYVSRPDQQEAQLYAVYAGGGNPQLLAKARFQNLAPGETATLSVERVWGAGQEEFPPTSYRLVIAYDPDIRSDGNPKNDDCRMNNNTMDRATSEISGLLR